MAEVPYKASPNVEPSGQIPIHPYEAKATPENFGGLIAKGIGEAGKEISGVGDRWGQIQVDYSLNNSLKEAEGVVTGYENLRGQDALEQRQATLDQLDDIHSRAVQHLTADQVYRFDQAWRPYRDRLYAGKIQTHSTQQAYEFTTAQNNGIVERGNNLAANYYNDPNVVEYARITALQGAAKQLQLNGMDRNPDVVAKVFNAAESGVYKSAAEAMFAAHPKEGLAYIEEHRKELGEHYAALAERFQNRAIDDTSRGNADAWTKEQDAARAGTPAGVRVTPKPEASAERPSGWQLAIRPRGTAVAINPNSQADPHSASVRSNNPGAQWPNKISEAYGSTGHENLRDGNKIATFPSPINGGAANMALLADQYSGLTIGAIQRKWSGQSRSSLPGYASDMVVTPAMLHNRDFMVTFMKNMAEAEARNGSSVMNDQQWQQAFDMYERIGTGQRQAAVE